MPLVVEPRQRDGWAVLALEGRIDGETAPDLHAAIQEMLVAKPPRVALDLEAVEYMSSAGLRVLLRTLKAVSHWQGSLQVVAPQPDVARVLALSGFDKLLTIADALGAAAD